MCSKNVGNTRKKRVIRGCLITQIKEAGIVGFYHRMLYSQRLQAFDDIFDDKSPKKQGFSLPAAGLAAGSF